MNLPSLGNTWRVARRPRSSGFMAFDTSFLSDKINGSCDLAGTVYEHCQAIVSFTFGMVSIALYAYLIKVICTRKSFQHPFFYQFIFLAISNIILWITIYVSQRVIPNPVFCSLFYPDFSTPSRLLKPLILGYYIPLTCQFITVITISINRMTVVTYPFTAPKFWAHHKFAVILIILILSFTCSFYLYDWNASVKFGITGRLLVNYVDGWPHIPFVLMSSLMSIICFITIVVTTTASLITLSKNSLMDTKSAEVNLFWTSFGFSLTTFVVVFYSITVFTGHYILQDENVTKFMAVLKGYLYDINCLLPAWVLVATNKQMRRIIWPRLGDPQVSAFLTQRSRSLN